MRLHTFEGGNIYEKQRNFDNEFYRQEEDLYNGKLKTEDMVKFLNSFPTGANDEKKIEAYKNFFTAILHHNRANEIFRLFHQQVTNRGKTMPSKTEYLTDLNNNPDCEEMMEREVGAMEYYEEALHLWHHTGNKRIEDFSIATLMADLEYRQAQRMNEGTENEKTGKHDALELNRQNYKRISKSMNSSAGLKAELGAITILRDHLQAQNIDHLFHIYHALPKNDHSKNTKIDLEVIFGDKIANIQIKSEAYDGARDDHTTGDIQPGTNVRYLIINWNRTIDALNNNQPGETNNETQKTFNKFVKILKNYNINIPKPPEKAEKNTELTIEEIINLHCPVARLLKEKMLTDPNVGTNISLIDDAKQKFADYLKNNPAGLGRVRQEIANGLRLGYGSSGSHNFITLIIKLIRPV